MWLSSNARTLVADDYDEEYDDYDEEYDEFEEVEEFDDDIEELDDDDIEEAEEVDEDEEVIDKGRRQLQRGRMSRLSDSLTGGASRPGEENIKRSPFFMVMVGAIVGLSLIHI